MGLEPRPKWFDLEGKYDAFYEPITLRGRGGFLLGLELEKLGRIGITAKKRHFCCNTILLDRSEVL